RQHETPAPCPLHVAPAPLSGHRPRGHGRTRARPPQHQEGHKSPSDPPRITGTQDHVVPPLTLIALPCIGLHARHGARLTRPARLRRDPRIGGNARPRSGGDTVARLADRAPHLRATHQRAHALTVKVHANVLRHHPSVRSRFTTIPRCVVREKWGLLSQRATSPTTVHTSPACSTRSLAAGGRPSVGANTSRPITMGPPCASSGADSPAWPRGATA